MTGDDLVVDPRIKRAECSGRNPRGTRAGKAPRDRDCPARTDRSDCERVGDERAVGSEHRDERDVRHSQ